MIEEPLVSVIVITYNSAKTILETLDSIAAQTYQKIELIISDDCSKDDTVKVVKSWLDDHKSRFVTVELVTAKSNTGIVKNINRGARLAQGAWIKSIAGDDILKAHCIKSFVTFVQNMPDCKMCCCDLELFSSSNNDISKYIKHYNYYFTCVNEPYKKQWKRVKYEMIFPGPGYFYSKSLYDEVNGFDEDYIMLEELPFVFSVLKRGYRIYPVQDKLVLYRVSLESACHTQNILNNTFIIIKNELYKFFCKYQRPALLKSGMFLTAIEYSIMYIVMDKRINFGENSIQEKIAKCLFILSPLHYINFLKKMIDRYYRVRS